MREHHVRVYPSAATPVRSELLAWQLALVAHDTTPLAPDVADMIVNRIIDNTGVAVAALRRRPVANARAQALAHPHVGGATVIGVDPARRVSCEWAAWANATAVRELDFHDTFLAEDMNHPGDMIAALIAVGQQCGASGAQLMQGVATAYEVSGALTTSIALHPHRIDHLPHIAAGMVAGIGAMLRLAVPVIYQALNHAVHVTVTTRQSRKGEISSWKAYAPAFAAKAAIEAVDRAMRGETSPAPIYEGEDGVIAWLLGGPDARYHVALPAPGEAKRAILDSYTKEHSAEYQAQAWIDLARRLHREHPEWASGSMIERVVIHSSHHTHAVIGSGSGDPQKYDPSASRETLDHSLPYIFAVALQDGTWHHETSYAPERARRADTIALWRSITTVEDPEWSRRYLSHDPALKAFGGWVEIVLTNGTTVVDEIVVPDAHPLGARPFARRDYVAKFRTLAQDALKDDEVERFLDAAQNLDTLSPADLSHVTFRARRRVMESVPEPAGLL